MSLIQFYLTRNKSLLWIIILQGFVFLFVISTQLVFNETYNDSLFFIKIFASFIPFAYLIYHSTSSYSKFLKSQKTLKLNQDRLQYIAAHDNLTGLYNRHTFERCLKEAIVNSKNNNQYFSLFILDIDNFKAINDKLGHSEGDLLIKQFTQELISLARQNDIFARIGVDEFALIIPNLNSPLFAKKLAERMLKNMQSRSPIDPNKNTTASIGIAIYPLDGETSAELIKKADIAMYNAKKSGKNTYCMSNWR